MGEVKYEHKFLRSSPKVVISIKARPQLKMRLNEEAIGSGMRLSEYGELLLENRHDREVEVQRIKSENNALKAQLSSSTSHEPELLREENLLLKKQLSDMQNSSILNDKRLLQLFEKLKGKKDRIKNAAGADFDIVYETVTDVLIALIYGAKIN